MIVLKIDVFLSYSFDIQQQLAMVKVINKILLWLPMAFLKHCYCNIFMFSICKLICFCCLIRLAWAV